MAVGGEGGRERQECKGLNGAVRNKEEVEKSGLAGEVH